METTLGSIALLLPARDPDGQLPALLAALARYKFGAILLVDDGSAASSQPYFTDAAARPGVEVLRHASNQGKGCALKTGITAFVKAHPRLHGLVTADSDGQHTAEDIARVATSLAEGRAPAVLGCRVVEQAGPGARVPLRSAFGNGLTRALFRLLYGVRLGDTQTGLRGFSRELLPGLLTVPGERYEYETAVLIHLCRAGIRPLEVPVATVYLEGNRGSHFRPVADSVRIYAALLRPLFRRAAGREPWPSGHGVAIAKSIRASAPACGSGLKSHQP